MKFPSGGPLDVVFFVLVLIGLGLGLLALIRLLARKNNQPPRTQTMGTATVGMFFMIGAGAVFYFITNR